LSPAPWIWVVDFDCGCSKMGKKSAEVFSLSMSTRKPRERRPGRWLLRMLRLRERLGWLPETDTQIVHDPSLVAHALGTLNVCDG
jgi:hypothetical protein